MNIRYLIIFSVLSIGRINAQCPTSSFDVPSSVCLQENINLENASTGAASYEWLVCSTNYSNVPSFSKLLSTINGTNIGSVYYSKFLQFNGETFLYFISNVTNRLYGVRITNSETLAFQEYTEIDISSITTSAAGFDIVNDNGTWVGLISKISTPYALTKIILSDDLKTITSSTNLSAGLTLASPFDIKILKDDGNYFAFIANQAASSTQQVLRLSFGNSLSNSPTANYISMPSGVQSASFDFYESCGSWTGFLSSRNGKIFRLDFGSNLSTSPVITELVLGLSLNDPGGIAFIKEHDHFILLSQSRNGFFYSIDLGLNISNNTPTVTSLGNFKTSSRDWDIEVLKIGSQYKIVTTNFTTGGTGGIYAISFSQVCPASISYSENEEERISFSQSGTHKITLMASSINGERNYSTRQITVSSSSSPILAINSSDAWCLSSPINLSYSSDLTIASQEWEFGDSQISPAASPSHQYAMSGDYITTVEATATNGCKNIISKVIKIFDPPQPSFEIPSINPICTNNEFTFINNTMGNFGGYISYQWYVNSLSVGSERDLAYTFLSSGSKTIRLETIIPGCTNGFEQLIPSVETGPTVDFTVNGQCLEQEIEFTNQSSGDIVTSTWNFDGELNSELNPIKIYNTPGLKSVILTTIGSNNCESIKSEIITIYSLPLANFQLELPPFSCNGMPSQFTDLTPNPTDSNITSWSWDFNDTGSNENTSLLKNPTHIYDNVGQYDVTLTAGTNYGCENSITKNVMVSQSPSVEIVNTPACDDVPVTFSTSSQNELKNWNWQIGITQFTSPEPTYLFTNPGNYTVNLNAVGNNNCIASTSKNVVVPQRLVPDFSVLKNCVGQPAEFTSTTTIYDDPIALYNWTFGDTGVGTGSPASHVYQTTGSFNVNLSVTSQSGCQYGVLKNIVVGNPPQASFTAQPEVGVPPLQVSFLNTSSNADHYLWSFNDESNSTSTEVSPQFTFLNYGNYVVDLTAFNVQNCSHTFSKVITGALPLLDVGLENLTISESANGSLSGQVVIHNKGNVTIQNLNLLINLSGIEIQQTVDESIPPYSSILYTLDFNIVNGSKLEYLCVEADLIGDINQSDNSVCNSLNNEVVIVAPYPNPSQGMLHVDWISPDDQKVSLSIYDPLGKMVFDTEVGASKGFNSTLLSMEGVTQGVYFLVFHSEKIKQTFRLGINR